MSWIWGLVLGVLATPFIIVGWTEMIKKDQKKEIEELIELIQTKDNPTEQEDLFIIVARQHLNNLEKTFNLSIFSFEKISKVSFNSPET